MNHRSNAGISALLIVVVLIAIFAIAGVYLVVTFVKFERAILEVSNLSLNPTEIKVTQSATLTFTLKSNDEARSHSLKVVFNTTSPVTFYQNDESLHENDDGFQYLPITLQSSQQSTYPLKVNGTLTGGASTSTYPIRIDFYDENSTRFDTESVNLKISQ